MPRVTFESLGLSVDVDPGATILDAAKKANVPLNSDCHFGWCGSDPIVLLEGEEKTSPPDDDEAENLAFNHFPKGVRMACVTKVFGDIRVRLFNL